MMPVPWFLRRQRAVREEGFSLLELLVTMGIISLLATITITAYINQKKHAWDAALKTDLRNAAMVLTLTGKTNAELRSAFQTNDTIVVGKGATSLINWPVWNSDNGTLPITVSDGTIMEMVMIQVPISTWTRKHEDGDFCIQGVNNRSHYDYIPGEGDARKYDKYLFYDVAYGGVADMKTLAVQLKAGKQISCYGHVQKWLTATGQ